MHYKLTREHLGLLSKTKACLDSETYMQCYCMKLRKVTDASFSYDIKMRKQYLDDLKAFCGQKLDRRPQYNSLRALILYNLLVFYERQGTYDKKVLKQYMKIPRDTEYTRVLYASAKNKADLDYAVELIPELHAIRDDTPYIRRALRHIFTNFDDKISKWNDVMDADYLKKFYCEVKLTKGQGKLILFDVITENLENMLIPICARKLTLNF
eukprot:UN31031